MNEKIKKSVLIVDDQEHVRDILRTWFGYCSDITYCPYEFDVAVAESAAHCVDKIRERGQTDGAPFDVIVLDVRMDGDRRSGLDTAFVLALYEELGVEKPVQIVFTGYPSYSDCVEAMRYGAWDYIVKEDVGETPAAQVVLNSAVKRLRQLDLRREQESQIAASWIPTNLLDLQTKYGGQFVALWHVPGVSVIASGRDAFELEGSLKDWRREHDDWERPFVIQVPPRRGDHQEEN